MMCHSCSCVMIVSAAAAAAAAAPQQQIMKAPSSSPSHHRFLTHRLMNAVQRNPWKSLAGAGVFASMAYYHYTKKEESSEKKLLELPFYKLKIVEQRQGKWQQQLSRSTNNNNAIVMPVDELVELIHQAAQDPNIVGLYGIFGNGHGFSTGGWAHAQEIRNALCVFQQSHRTHDGTDAAAPQKKKVCSAYANTFASPLPNGLQEYYLATAFGSIGLQTHGDLNIFGLYSTNTFFKDCLQKYGIQVDVFKHGLYKNFANQFTHNRYTQEHKTNVWNIVQQINKHVHETIFVSRQLNQKFQSSDTFWSMVHQAGSFPAETAKMIGFIDSTPCRVDSKSLLAGEDDHKTISIAEYAKLKQTQKRKQEKQWKLYQQLKSFAEQNAVMEQLLSMIGYQGPHYNIPEVSTALSVGPY